MKEGGKAWVGGCRVSAQGPRCWEPQHMSTAVRLGLPSLRWAPTGAQGQGPYGRANSGPSAPAPGTHSLPWQSRREGGGEEATRAGRGHWGTHPNSGRRNARGLGLPGCGSGVMDPTSTKPNPSPSSGSTTSASLSNPAATPAAGGGGGAREGCPRRRQVGEGLWQVQRRERPGAAGGRRHRRLHATSPAAARGAAVST